MRIAVAQINPVLADFQFNKEKILDFVNQAVQRKCDLVVFPECTLFGYHPFDLLEREKLVAKQEAEFKDLIKKLPKNIGVIMGLITRNPAKKGRPYFNSAALIAKGEKPRFFHKQLLPTGDVFDEARFIESGDVSKNYFKWKGKKFFLTICEDIWAWPDAKGNSPYRENPLAKVKKQKIDMVINLSASPYFVGKMKQREYVTQKTAAYFNAPIMYVNLVGAQDEIIFDGGSFVLDKKGKKLLTCQQFSEDINVIDLNTLEVWNKNPKLEAIEELRRALVLGIRDFCEKTGIKKVHLGLSGGIDSAVVAVLAVDALGPANVVGVGLPGPFNAPQSLTLAKDLASNMGVDFKTVEIGPMYESVLKALNKGLGLEGFSIVNENLQARLRGLTLMAWSNKENSMLLTTGNKSEYASGYSTLYGDMCGGLAPLGDLTKAQVYALARYYNKQGEVIPQEIIDRPPSAELRPNQKDQDSLPEYDDLDKAVTYLVEKSGPAKSATEKWLLPVLMRTEFKRWQAPPILKVSQHSFGRGRRYPVAHRAREI
ncbi:NAD+ synthase [Bdellovibrio bacteriovorus]|uniref:Glutamine-dependent NAD(+) synthetase n=1 Tax=Bdellovibrio bacteriovorus (strain ATCC 15356 / DSM 50701 / NCIMB 9529 / HD100) TaxID=264462 RepID=Q6MGT5_BDEBA|nr:NAD+ synthase [Bdellovibrio bacteriovorus]CAE81194.1 NH(3)-dependent NAD(+) synthetase [Bdellovibrio bacteriovorus HD100]